MSLTRTIGVLVMTFLSKLFVVSLCLVVADRASADWYVPCESSLGGQHGVARLKNDGSFRQLIGADVQTQPTALLFTEGDVFTVVDFAQVNSPLRQYFADGTEAGVPVAPSFHPGFIFALEDGTLIVTEYFGGPIYRFTQGGVYLGVWGSTNLNRQNFVQSNEQGDIFVGGFYDPSLVRLNQSGAILDTFPNNNVLVSPGGLLWKGGNAYLSEVSDNSIRVLDANGSLVASWTTGLSQPARLTEDNGTLLVPGSASNNIKRFAFDGTDLGELASGLGTPTQIVKGPNVERPTALTVRRGRVDSGNLHSLDELDGDRLRICRFIVPNSIVPPVEFEVTGHSANLVPQLLVVCLNSRSATGGSFQQRVAWFDKNGVLSAANQRVDRLTTTLTAVRQYVDVPADVVAADGTFRVQVSVKSVGPTVVLTWCTEFDRVAFTIK